MKRTKKLISIIMAVMICITALSVFTVSAASDLDKSKKYQSVLLVKRKDIHLKYSR